MIVSVIKRMHRRTQQFSTKKTINILGWIVKLSFNIVFYSINREDPCQTRRKLDPFHSYYHRACKVFGHDELQLCFHQAPWEVEADYLLPLATQR
jgi:hypothetical protein